MKDCNENQIPTDEEMHTQLMKMTVESEIYPFLMQGDLIDMLIQEMTQEEFDNEL